MNRVEIRATIYSALVATLVCSLFLGVTYLHANWSEPGTNPPNGNIAAPVNTGSVNQDKEGGFGADTLAAYNAFNFVFKNTSANDWTAWRLVRNDGTGNFHTYLNSKGGNNPTHETTGHAFHEEYNPGNGIYEFSTSNGSGSADSSITWQNAFKIFPDGRVGAKQYCDINGNSCEAIGGGGISSCVTRTESGRTMATAYCEAGEVRTGGGCTDMCSRGDDCSTPAVSSSAPVGNSGWRCDVVNDGLFDDAAQASVICCS